MTEFFHATVDKFTFLVAKDRLYTEDGVWVLPIHGGQGPLVRLGVTDFFQQHNGDVASANIQPAETQLAPVPGSGARPANGRRRTFRSRETL